jgi:hypothetical protein
VAGANPPSTDQEPCTLDEKPLRNPRRTVPDARRPRRTLQVTVSTHRADNSDEQHLELPVEELVRRARPLPPHDEMVIEDLTEEEGAAFLAAVDS